MVCYARPVSMMAALVLVVIAVFGRPVGHFFDAAALMLAITVAAGVAALAAVVAVAATMSIRRRRAAAGGCVGCQFRCQHAMTERPRRLLVSSAPQREPGAPRWPDRPTYRSAPPAVSSRPVPVVIGSRPAGQRERAGVLTRCV
jgi:uncharacterized protein (DUF58 family)